MKKRTDEEIRQLERELYNQVNDWVQTFNFIQVSTLQAVCEVNDTILSEHIKQEEITWKVLEDYLGIKISRYQRLKLDLDVTNHESYDSCFNNKSSENYPMWNTCFEFKNEPGEEVLKAAKDAGFGIINAFEDFNTLLFVAGAGYSFYASHWIPLWLNLPWNSDERKKYKGIKYNHL